MHRQKRRQKQEPPEQALAAATQKIEHNRYKLAEFEHRVSGLRGSLARAEAEYQQLEANLNGRGFFNRTFGEGARIEAQRREVYGRICKMREDLKIAEFHRSLHSSGVAEGQLLAADAEKRINELRRAAERERSKGEVEQRKEERRRAEHALAARATKQDRALAAQLRHQLERDHECPYCGNWLADNAQLDHIYPLACGGLSVRANLVFVCANCNSRKRDLTLNEFINRFDLSQRDIFERLDRLGKRF